MQNWIYFILIIASFFTACSDDKQAEKNTKTYPAFTSSNIDTNAFKHMQEIYVPVYSTIYINKKDHLASLTSTLSIRNISHTDTVYASSIIFYDTEGNLVSTFINKPVLVKPMQTIQVAVEESNTKGIGANFVVKWGATRKVPPPIVQAVMIGTTYNMGISFLSDGVVIKETLRDSSINH